MQTQTHQDQTLTPAQVAAIRDALSVRDFARETHNFLDERNLARLARLCRLYPVLIRFNSGRFTCPAQDARHFISIIEDSNKDYVRDVSAPAGFDLVADMERVARYIAEVPGALDHLSQAGMPRKDGER